MWDGVKADRDGEILLEVSDAVRETLIASMNREELVAAVESLEADEIAAHCRRPAGRGRRRSAAGADERRARAAARGDVVSATIRSAR